MKNKLSLLALIWLIGFNAFAQFPVQVVSTPNTSISTIDKSASQNLDVLLFKEGYNLQTNFSNTVTYTGGATIGEIRPVYAGENAYVRAIVFTASKSARIACRIGRFQATGVNSPTPFDIFNSFVYAGQSITVPINALYGSAKYFSFVFDADTTTPEIAGNIGQQITVSATLIGQRICSDLDFNADFTIWGIGDSIWRNSNTNNLNLLAGETWLFRLKDKINTNLSTRLKRIRLINTSIEGKTTTNFERTRLNNELEVDRADIILYGLCVNDAIDGTAGFSNTAYDNFVSFIKYKQRRYPNSYLVLVGGTPLQNNTANSNLVTIRSRMVQAVTEAADPKIIYISQESTFDRTISGNYSTSDAAGSGVHPVGNTNYESMATNIYNALVSAGIINQLK